MTVYESLITEDKQRSFYPPPPICCDESCNEPSFWDLLPQCQLNWIAFGLTTLAIGFGLIGLGAINVGNVLNLSTNPLINTFFDSTTLAQGTSFIVVILGVIALTTWFLFKACNDDWGIVVVASLVGASAFPLAAAGLIYLSIADLNGFPPGFDRTWFNIAISLIVLSIAGFLFLAYLLFYSPCHKCISAKKAVVVSLIFLIGGSAAYSLGRFLWVAVVTYQLHLVNAPHTFPPTLASAFEAFIFVSIVNIVLVVALGWYILDCAVANCFFIFLPLFASAASLGNWALYRVGLNVISYFAAGKAPPPPVLLPADTPYTQFAIAIGLVSITALILTFVIVKYNSNAAALTVASAILLLYAIGTYTYVATAGNLLVPAERFVNDILIGIFSGIGVTAVLDLFLRYSATCPIPTIIYGFASGSFGWAIIYLYSTYSANIFDFDFIHNTDPTTLSTGLNVILGIAIASILFIRFFACDELLSALTLLNVALLTVGAGGFFGTLAYYLSSPLNASDVTASMLIYAIFALAALFLPRFFAGCKDIKRQLVIAVAALSAGIAAVDFGRAVVLSRAVAFDSRNIANFTFSPLVYIASAAGTAFIGQVIVWIMSQSSIYTALPASFMGLIASGISLQVIFFVNGVDLAGRADFELIGTPWLIFTLALVVLLVLLQIRSLCIPQSCRFSIGLLIPALTIAVVGKFAGASAALGALANFRSGGTLVFPSTFAVNSRMILLNSIIPLVAFFVSLKIFCCNTHLAYLPTSIAFASIIYVTSQFELFNLNLVSGDALVYIPFLNPITRIYFDFNFGTTTPGAIPAYVTFITQTYLVYLLFLAPALIVGVILACFKPVCAATIGTAIAATAVSLGAVGIANVISGILSVIVFASGHITDLITNFVTFAQFLEGIQSQFILFAVGVLTILFIYFGKCRYNAC